MYQDITDFTQTYCCIFQTINLIIFTCQQYKASQLELNVTVPAKDREEKMEKRHQRVVWSARCNEWAIVFLRTQVCCWQKLRPSWVMTFIGILLVDLGDFSERSRSRFFQVFQLPVILIWWPTFCTMTSSASCLSGGDQWKALKLFSNNISINSCRKNRFTQIQYLSLSYLYWNLAFF